MIELPEAVNLAKQFGETLKGRTVASVVAGASPHKFAWFQGDPAEYGNRLNGATLGESFSQGGLAGIKAGEQTLLFAEGLALKFLQTGEKRPVKHQLLIEFKDGTGLSASVQMYGGMWCFKEGEFKSDYFDLKNPKPSPLSAEFDEAYFKSLIEADGTEKLSAKALLATEQRIPGLGNGVLQDILYNAGVHPKRKYPTLTDTDKQNLFTSVKTTLKEMADQGGRDTEKNLFGEPGGYTVLMSKNTVGQPCPKCGGTITKQAFMGGSVYVCEGCQKL